MRLSSIGSLYNYRPIRTSQHRLSGGGQFINPADRNEHFPREVRGDVDGQAGFRLGRQGCQAHGDLAGSYVVVDNFPGRVHLHQIIRQCLEFLQGPFARSKEFNPQAACPKKIRPVEGDYFFTGETPRGELSFFFRCDGKSDVPLRLKARTPSFCNLSALPLMSSNLMLADLIAVVGSLDLVMGEVDR